MNQYLLSIMEGKKNGFVSKLITYLLLPWSWVYGLAVFCHRNSYRFKHAYHPPRPVISIGNLTMGGVGKTPLVIWLAGQLQEKGIKPVILIRGYMPKGSQVSDEVKMLYEQIPFIPVLAGSDRLANIKKTLGKVPVDVFICDDAFQHWPLKRDLNIVAINALNPFGNGHLLPAGILREGPSALKRAHVVVLTKTDGVPNLEDLHKKIHKINPRALIAESRHKTAGIVGVFEKNIPADFLRNQRVVAFCAIGDPASFESGLKNEGACVVKLSAFRDHHMYTHQDIQRLIDFCHDQNVSVLATTHKDIVKLRHFKSLFEMDSHEQLRVSVNTTFRGNDNGIKGLHLVYIPIQLEITKGSDEFLHKVMAVCSR